MKNKGKILAAPPLIWLILFFLLPLLIIVFYSFLQRGVYGELVYQFTLSNYVRLGDSVYLQILLDTLSVSILTTLLTLFIAYPLAYYISTLSQSKQQIWLLLVMLPFWINFLIRSFAWIIILRSQGIVNSLFIHLEWIDQPLSLLYNDGAVLLGMVYSLLPFMVLPLYISFEKLDRSHLEAASDLGANSFRVFMHIIIPLTSKGIIIGSVLVFVSSIGMFVVPDVMGGAKSMLLGNLIQNQFLSARDWPFGSAATLLLILFSLVLMMLYYYAAVRSKGGAKP